MEDGIPRWLQYHHKACCKKDGVIRQVCYDSKLKS